MLKSIEILAFHPSGINTFIRQCQHKQIINALLPKADADAADADVMI
jgi:hypothetical protein